jgi:DNA-binding XRE family transcriptional regulator
MVFWGAEMKPKYNKLTLSELAKKCGVSKQSIEKFFWGHKLRPEVKKKISDYLEHGNDQEAI